VAGAAVVGATLVVGLVVEVLPRVVVAPPPPQAARPREAAPIAANVQGIDRRIPCPHPQELAHRELARMGSVDLPPLDRKADPVEDRGERLSSRPLLLHLLLQPSGFERS
jgi:hypothetical protein